MKKSNAGIWHLLGCLTFLIVPIILSPRPAGMPLLSTPTLRDLLANCFMLLIFYSNYYLLIPSLYFRHKLVWYGTAILLGFLVITLLPSLLTGYVPWDPPQMPGNDFARGPAPVVPAIPEGSSFLTQVKHNILLYVAVVLFSLLLRIRMKLFNTELLRHRAEVGTLKNQINPHFLFNTLNNIYALAIREKSHQTASSIIKLSGMMRYVVTETEREFVALEKEITYINDYIDLQRMRLTTSLELSYVVTGSLAGKKIAPVVLIPFIENAFKHGVNPDRESYIRIAIEVAENAIALTVENQQVNAYQEMHTKSGVGIENTKSRLDLLYPKKYALKIDNSLAYYRITLTIDLA